MDEHPEVIVDLDLSDRIVDLVAEGFDLAIRVGVLGDSSLIARKVADVHMAVCAAPSLIDERGEPDHPDALRDWPGLCYTGSERPDLWRYRLPDGTAGSVAVKVRMLANNGPLLCEASAAGYGVVLQPSFHLYDAVAAGALVPILQDCTWPEIAVHIVYPQTRHLTARARAFIDFARGRIGDEAYWEALFEGARSR